jgi:benzoyl-CoA-dihydrodiol lyase
VPLTPLRREVDGDTTRYEHVRVVLDRQSGTATITVLGPGQVPGGVEELHEQGDTAWLLATTRELDDAILRLRTNELEIGTWLLRTEGDPAAVAGYDRFLLDHRDDWLVTETIGFYRRTVKRLDTTSRSLFALIEPGSCFVGTLAEIAFAADRQYMLEGRFEDDEDPAPPAVLRLDEFNTGLLPMSNDLSRLQVRFLGSADERAAAEAAVGRDLDAAEALALGLVTATPDDIDWEDEIRLVVEERASFSPDALTGMEANLRFAGAETPETKVFGRLTAWQNWIFQRPNAAGPEGALRRYGTGQRAAYDRKRV